MLVTFSVKNFMSFRDESILDMRAIEADKILPHNSFQLPFRKKTMTLLKSAVIYGSNASGKSNLIFALKIFRDFICQKPGGHEDEIPVTPFLLDKETAKKPTEMQIQLLAEGDLYRYGFSATKKHIIQEWLYITSLGAERLIFERERTENNKYTLNTGSSGKSFEKFNGNDAMGEHILLINFANYFNNEIASKLFDKISSMLPNYRIGKIDEENLYIISKLLQYADIGLNRLETRQPNMDILRQFVSENPENLIKKTTQSGITAEHIAGLQKLLSLTASSIEKTHKEKIFIYKDTDGDDIELNAHSQSQGTMHLLSAYNAILRVYRTGGVVLFDEIEDSLHPLIAEAFIDFIHSLPGNHFQVISTTHCIPLLHAEIFRRDQVWIVSKQDTGNSTISSISDYNGVRNNAKLGKQYLDDRFGGLPVIDPRIKADIIQQCVIMRSSGEK